VFLSLFSFVTLGCWIEFVGERARRFWYWLALVFYALALFSKTTPAPCRQRCCYSVAENQTDWLAAAGSNGSFLAMGLGMGLLTVVVERFHSSTQGKQIFDGLAGTHSGGEPCALFYAGKLFWPVNLTFMYPRWTIEPAHPSAYGWLSWESDQARRFILPDGSSGAVLRWRHCFYAATLSPLLGFVMVYTFRYTFVADHYQYAASMA